MSVIKDIVQDIETIPEDMKKEIPKWCNVKVKKKKVRGKVKKMKTHKFDTGKAQIMWTILVDKVNELIEKVDYYHPEPTGICTLPDGTPTNATPTICDNLQGTWIEGSSGGTGTDDTVPSDRRLKQNVNIVGKSPSGINIYTFKFKDANKYGNGLYQGVMSDEVPQSIVKKGKDGYDRVDYDKIDVNFVKVNNL